MRVNSPGPPGGAACGIWPGAGPAGARKNAVAPSPLESAFGFIDPPLDESGPPGGGATFGGGALPPKPDIAPARLAGVMLGAEKLGADMLGADTLGAEKLGAFRCGALTPLPEIEGPLTLGIDIEGP